MMRRLCILTISLMALAGCGRGTTPDDVEPPPTRSVITDVRHQDHRLPLQAYDPAPEQIMIEHAASEKLNSACARRFGVEYTAHFGSDANQMQEVFARRYGVDDLQQARSHGYRVVEKVHSGGNSASAEGHWDPDPAEILVMTGVVRDARSWERSHLTDRQGRPVPRGGCFADTERRLDAGLVSIDVAYVSLLQERSYELAERDDRVQAAWRSWSHCMSAEGYDYRSPWEPNDHAWGPKATRAEKRTATDDVRCRQRTRMLDTWKAVERGYQIQLINQHHAALNAVSDYRAGRLMNAHAVLRAR